MDPKQPAVSRLTRSKRKSLNSNTSKTRSLKFLEKKIKVGEYFKVRMANAYSTEPRSTPHADDLQVFPFHVRCV